jgi:hypothetical protein
MVSGADGRTWSVQRTIEWRSLRRGDEFEYDVGADRRASLVPLVVLALFWGVVIGVLYIGSMVHIPWWFFPPAVVVLLFFPIRWLTHRPRIIVAETPGGHHLPAERWIGEVHGALRSTRETRLAARNLRSRGTPGHAHSPLHPVS